MESWFMSMHEFFVYLCEYKSSAVKKYEKKPEKILMEGNFSQKPQKE